MDNKENSESLRKLNEIINQLVMNVDIINHGYMKSTSMTQQHHKCRSFNEELEEYLDLVNKRKQERNKDKFIASGFAQMDEIIGGFWQGELTVIGGRPGIGKTSLILSMINYHMRNQVPVAIYSLELTKEAIIDRLICMKEKIPITQLRVGKLTEKEYKRIEKNLTELSKSDFFFIEGSLFSTGDFSEIVSSLVNEKGIKILYIDYLQLIRSSHYVRNREQEISNHMRVLKSLALEFKIPVLLTSQMNRYVELRGGAKRPMLSDLRESGTIEEIADKVLFIYRPEAHGILMDEEGNCTSGKAELIIAKNRLGNIGDLILYFNKNYGLFENISWDKRVFPSLNLPDNPFNEGL